MIDICKKTQCNCIVFLTCCFLYRPCKRHGAAAHTGAQKMADRCVCQSMVLMYTPVGYSFTNRIIAQRFSSA